MERNKGKLKDMLINKSGLRYLYGILSVLACLFNMKPLCGQISESIRMCIYIVLLFCIINYKKYADKVYAVFCKKWHRILLFILELYAIFAIAGIYVLDSSAEYAVDYPAIIYLGIAYIWIRPIVMAVLGTLLSMGGDVSDDHKRITLRTRLILMGIVVFPCLLFMIGFNPAITWPDSQYCFYIAHIIWEKGVWMFDWNPPFHIFVLSILFKIYDSITFIIALQILCFAVVFVDGILYFYWKGVSKTLLTAIFCFITFGVSNIIQLNTFLKDTPFMISVMWLTILLIKYVLDQEVFANKPGWHIQMIIALVFTALFRQNGMIPAVTIIILLPAVSKISKKTVSVSIVSLLLILLVKYPLYDAMEVESAPQLKYFSLANDIMYSYYRGDTISADAMEIVNKVTSGDPDNFQHSPYWVHYNPDEPKDYTLIEFLRIYMDNFIRNPRDTVMALLCRSSSIWSIVRPVDENFSGLDYLIGFVPSYETDGYPDRNSNIVTTKLTEICNWMTSNSILYVLYWRTGIYNLLIIFMLGIIVLWAGKSMWLSSVLPFVPISLNILVLALSSGWNDYRYFWPSMANSLFLLCYLIIIRKKQAEVIEEV